MNNRSETLSPVRHRQFAAALMLGAALGASVGLAASQELSSAAHAAPITVPQADSHMSFAPLVSRVKPAVVQIATVAGGEDYQVQNIPEMYGPFGEMLRRYYGGQGPRFRSPEQRALGSGFIIDAAGYIVTNNHVIDGAREISITLNDGSKHRAKIIGRDDQTDLAVVKIDAGHDLPYVAFGNSDEAREGDWVLAVGNPFGLGGTVTAGIISAHGRNINEGPYDDFLQIDAPINPGNSGGPLFNQSGQVVGIDTAIYSPSGGSVGIGFAIPSNVAKSVVAQLREHGRVSRGWLGISMQALTPSLAKAAGLSNEHGVIVAEVTPGSPAAAADLHEGDVITAFDNRAISDGRDLALSVAQTPPGKEVDLRLWRDGRSLSARVTVHSRRQLTEAS